MTLEEARKIVFEAKPKFGEFFNAYKDKTWPEYIKENYPTSFKAPQNFNELEDALQNILSPLLGKEKANHAVSTLKSRGFVGTADHAGVLCHPFFANSVLVRRFMFKDESVICFTSGGVSLTNSSLPRSVYFHDQSLQQVKIPLVHLSGRRRSVYGLPAFSKKKIQSIVDSIPHFDLSAPAASNLQKFFCKILKDERIFGQIKYSDQLVILNNLLFESLFGPSKSNLVYVEIERMVRDLLLKTHLDQESLIHQILFYPDVRNSYIENLEGKTGAHDTKEKSGSHLFWYIDEREQTRVQLFLKDNQLQSIDQKITIDLTPEALRKHLENYTLLPSMALCYSIISFYYGITLGGGFGQIKYLGDIKDAWEKTASVAGVEIEHPRTDIFSGGFVLTGVSNGSKTKPASLLDALIYSPDIDVDYLVRPQFAEDRISAAINESKIGNTIDALLGDIVAIITGEKPNITDLKVHKTFKAN